MSLASASVPAASTSFDLPVKTHATNLPEIQRSEHCELRVSYREKDGAPVTKGKNCGCIHSYIIGIVDNEQPVLAGFGQPLFGSQIAGLFQLTNIRNVEEAVFSVVTGTCINVKDGPKSTQCQNCIHQKLS